MEQEVIYLIIGIAGMFVGGFLVFIGLYPVIKKRDNTW